MVVPGGNLIGSSIFLSLSYATFLSIFLWERKERARKKRKEKRADGRFAPARRPLPGHAVKDRKEKTKKNRSDHFRFSLSTFLFIFSAGLGLGSWLRRPFLNL